MPRKSYILPILITLLLITACQNKSNKEFTIWIGGAPQEIDFWQKIVGRYNQISGNNAVLIRQPTYTDQRRQSLIVSLEAKQPNPDLFLMDVVWINQFAKSNWLEPLNKYIERDNYSIDKFFERVINSVDKLERNIYALPIFLDVGLLYYRKDLLKKYGFANPPQTWKQLINLAKLVQRKEREINKDFYGFVWQGAQYEGLICNFMEFIYSFGGSITNENKIQLITYANTSALTFMHNLIYKYKISPLNTYTEMREEEVRRSFQNGNALFERNWTYAWNQHQSSGSSVKGKVGIAELPHEEGSSSASALGGWHVGLSKYSDVKYEAWDFIKFITSYEIQKKLLLDIGWNPSRKDIYSDSVLLNQIPRLKILYEAFNHSVPRPVIPYYTQVSEIMQRYINNCLANKITPEEAISNMQTEIDKVTANYESH
ncbi:ABC transporter substrate-binding protein [Melioribacteraceae bacterium 4301-Me]|uniref:ABC transporter substrate-binding protein n=1 Tax=Pyranulibacter aquaticus TaxID=3163344 RepID=UPI003596F132